MSEDLEDVWDELCPRSDQILEGKERRTGDILCQDDLGRTKERSLEGGQGGWRAFTDKSRCKQSAGHSLFCDDLPYQCRNTLEAVLVELRIARILADLAHHVD